jgi:hypothetical protein
MRAEIASRSCSATADAYASLFSERPMRDMARRKAILVHAVRQGSAPKGRHQRDSTSRSAVRVTLALTAVRHYTISRRLALRIGSVNAASAPGQRIGIRPTRLPTRIWLDSGPMSVSGEAGRRRGCHAQSRPSQCRWSSGSDGKVDAMAVEPETIVTAKCDLLSPNALGAILDNDTIPRLNACVTARAAASRLGAERAV